MEKSNAPVTAIALLVIVFALALVLAFVPKPEYVGIFIFFALFVALIPIVAAGLSVMAWLDGKGR